MNVRSLPSSYMGLADLLFRLSFSALCLHVSHARPGLYCIVLLSQLCCLRVVCINMNVRRGPLPPSRPPAATAEPAAISARGGALNAVRSLGSSTSGLGDTLALVAAMQAASVHEDKDHYEVDDTNDTNDVCVRAQHARPQFMRRANARAASKCSLRIRQSRMRRVGGRRFGGCVFELDTVAFP